MGKVIKCLGANALSSEAVIPNVFGTSDRFHGNPFSTDWGWVSGDGFGMIQMHFISCALYIYYYYISSTSDHYALDPKDWRTLL